jgi:hypothetical protein
VSPNPEIHKKINVGLIYPSKYINVNVAKLGTPRAFLSGKRERKTDRSAPNLEWAMGISYLERKREIYTV